MKHYKISIALILLSILYFTACEIEEPTTDIEYNLNVRSLMNTEGSSSWASLTSGLRVPIDFELGINGHPGGTSMYGQAGNTKIFTHLQSMGITHYRYNVPEAFYKNSALGQTAKSELVNLINEANSYGIKVLPMFYFFGQIFDGLPNANGLKQQYQFCGKTETCEACSYDPTITTNQGYQDTLSMVYNYMTDYGREIGKFLNEVNGKVTHVNLENEINTFYANYIGTGMDKSTYNPCMMKIITEAYKGMISGIREFNTTAKTIINPSCDYQIGFFDYLEDENVPYDEIGINWYYGPGTSFFKEYVHYDLVIEQFGPKGIDFLETLHLKYGKDIRILEINRQNGLDSIDNWAPIDNSENSYTRHTFDIFIQALLNRDYIKGIYFYELMGSEHGLAYLENNTIINRPIGNYIKDLSLNGFINLTRKDYETDAIWKPEPFYYHPNGRSDNELLVLNLFMHHFGRLPESTTSLNYNVGLIEQNNYETYVDDVLSCTYSNESYNMFIADQYRKILDREPDAGGLTHYYNLMKNGFSREDLIWTLLNSNEFYSNNGNNNEDFIETIYLKLINREPTSSELTDALTEINNYGKGNVISTLMSSTEYYSVFVSIIYNQYLHKEPSLSDLNWHVNKLDSGWHQNNSIRCLLLTDEFINDVRLNLHKFIEYN